MLEALPTTRSAKCPFDPPTRIAEPGSLQRMKYPNGHEGWLATKRETVRAILADPRFSIRYELLDSPVPGLGTDGPLPAAQPGDFTGLDAPEHTRYRRLLTGEFTVRRMRQLTARVEEIVAEHLDAMAKMSGPVDLVQAFALPVPMLVICELLGVPYEDRDRFQEYALTLAGVPESMEEYNAAVAGFGVYLNELVLAKRANPTDDLLSGLTTSDLTDAELGAIAGLLLGAGLGTTKNMISLGTVALLRHPEQLEALRQAENFDVAVEELLRYLTIFPFTMRAALEDVEVDGQLIKKGETVTLSVQTANRDQDRFEDPDTLKLDRAEGGHLAFGHGIHQCLGQQLARVEMQVAFRGLINRFPTLRLAVPFEELPGLLDGPVFEVTTLPVTWD